jgi:hypothetical protein
MWRTSSRSARRELLSFQEVQHSSTALGVVAQRLGAAVVPTLAIRMRRSFVHAQDGIAVVGGAGAR